MPVYTPAVQIDGGALLLVGAVASVLLPRSALAYAAGDLLVVRRYYIRGTLATFFLLLIVAPVLWFIAPYFFNLWFGNPMAATSAILPLMLIHTVGGGSAAVGAIDIAGHRKGPAVHGLRADRRGRQRRSELRLRPLRAYGARGNCAGNDRGGYGQMRDLDALVYAAGFKAGYFGD